MSFEPSTAIFQLGFVVNTTIQQPTVVYINEDLNYPHGALIRVSPSNALSWTSSSRNYYEFQPTSSISSGTSVTIIITAKPAYWHTRLWFWLTDILSHF
jgi:hypothetical protein